MSFFLSPLCVEMIEEGKWRLHDPLIFHSRHLGELAIPAGFETDFASVPRLPVAYLLAGGIGDKAAVVHDYLYRTVPHICSRKTADDVFFDALIVSGVSGWRAYLMWLAVRIAGNSSWRSESHATSR